MTSKIPHVSGAAGSERPFITNPGAKNFSRLAKNAVFRIFHPSSLILLPFLLVTGCASTVNHPVIVTVTDDTQGGGRFRSGERQRDVWIAPQAVDNEVLQHEQVVTFVERPAAWQLPSTLEPNAISNPQLPNQEGDYDSGLVQRQKEMIAEAREQTEKLADELGRIKQSGAQDAEKKDELLRQAVSQLQSAQKQLNDANQRLGEIQAAEKLRRQQEDDAKHKVKKSWWPPW